MQPGGYYLMQQQAQCFLITTKKPELITKTNTFQKPKPTCGRPSDRLSSHQLKQAMAIVCFDMKKQGRILLWGCPEHGDQALSYRYQKGDGVHAWCEVPGCKANHGKPATNHWDEFHFQGQDDEDE
jgi:hypothetical protein